MRKNEDGQGNGDEGDAVANDLHHPGEVEDEKLPLHVSIWKWVEIILHYLRILLVIRMAQEQTHFL